MSRITMSAASFSAASAAIRFASWAVLAIPSKPLPTRVSLARALTVEPFRCDHRRDGLGHRIPQILAAADGLPDRGRGEIDRFHLERDHIRAGLRGAGTGRDDDGRQLTHALGRVPPGEVGVIRADDQEEPALRIERLERLDGVAGAVAVELDATHLDAARPREGGFGHAISDLR